jgi:hypothetical protein
MLRVGHAGRPPDGPPRPSPPGPIFPELFGEPFGSMSLERLHCSPFGVSVFSPRKEFGGEIDIRGIGIDENESR